MGKTAIYRKHRVIWPDQILAGARIAGLSLEALAEEAGTTRQTLWRYCYRNSDSVDSILEAIRHVLELHGVVLIEPVDGHGPGVARATNR